jgi:hypothetical protein
VDLEAEPVIDRDNPPDLKELADAATPMAVEDTPAAQVAATIGAATTAAHQAVKAVAGSVAAAVGSKKADKAATKPVAGKAAAAGAGSGSAASQRQDDVLRLTDELVDKVGHAKVFLGHIACVCRWLLGVACPLGSLSALLSCAHDILLAGFAICP